MTNTLPSKARPPKPSPRARDSAVGQFREKRNPINLGMGLLTPLLGQEFLDRHNLRDPLNRALKFGVKHGFSAAGTSTRQFKKIQGLGKPATRLAPSTADYFDLTPDDDQRMIVETVKQFAEEILRPAARAADDAASYPADLITRAAELGVTAIKVPEDFDGIADQRTAVTNALVAEALSYGDMGLALPILAPGGVASALTHWGTADQQATYLREFAGENVPQACLAIAEPHPLFDPTMLKTTAVRTPSGYRLDGVKSLVPAAADAELFVIAAQLNGRPTLFIVESDTAGLSVTADRSMGLRAAALGRIELDKVSVPLAARLGGSEGTDSDYARDYSEAIALSRLGWAALAVGTSHAVLDYVIPYVKEREAFGKPIFEFQNTKFTLAEAATDTHVARVFVDSCIERHLKGELDIQTVAMAKWWVTERASEVADECLQLFGGYGYMTEYPISRMWVDARVQKIYAGTNEIMKEIIARTL